MNENGLGLFYKEAFDRLGCETLMTGALNISPRNSFYGRALNRLFANGISKDRTHKKHFAILLETAQRFAPDIVITIRCEMLDPSTAAELSSLCNDRHFNIYPDSPIQIPGVSRALALDALREYTAILTFSKVTIPVFYQLGARAAHWLPFAFDPNRHRPNPTALKDLEFSYFGTWGPAPQYWLHQASPMEVAIFGNGWEKLHRKSPLRRKWVKNESLKTPMAEMISRSKVVFNLIRPEHGCAHSMKTFEIPASGGFMLTNWTEEQEYFLKPDHEAVYFNCRDELIDKGYFYLSNERARLKIAKNGMEAVKPHTYDSRARTVLSYVETGAWIEV